MEMREYGLYWQGLMHDMSKFSPIEFRVAKFYNGTRSPIAVEKELNGGYSASWQHHVHHNPHHWQHYRDHQTGAIGPIPKKYLQEMVCDIIAASKTYNGKNYTPDMPIEYLVSKKDHPQQIVDLLLPMLQEKLK